MIPMKTLTQFLSGTLSSLLLSAGFVRAAAQLDPVRPHSVNVHSLATSFCVGPCSYR
jgi:hypothetical protein